MIGHQQFHRRLRRNRVEFEDSLVPRVPADPTTANGDASPTAQNTNTAAVSTPTRGPQLQTSATSPPTSALATSTPTQERTSQTTAGNTSNTRNTSAGRNTGTSPSSTPSPSTNADTESDTSTGTDSSSNTQSQAQDSRIVSSGALTTPVLSGGSLHTTSVTASLTSAQPTETATDPTETNAANAAGVIGGIIAFIIGIVLLTFTVRKLVSLRKRRNEDPDQFNASDFRRSAVLINDLPNHSDTVSRGYNPRPPSMIERKLNRSPTFNRQGYGEGVYDNFIDHPPLPPLQPAYPETAYMSSMASPSTPGFGSPYESTFEAANQNPYVMPQSSAGAAGVGVYEVDYSMVSQVSTPVTASFESPAIFVPMNTDTEPLYSPTHRQEFGEEADF